MSEIKREILKKVPLYSIKPYAMNYQDHSKNINHIKNSIKDFGYNKVSITVDEDMIMLTGHGTLLALEQLKYKQVPFVLKISGLSDSQKKAYRIADNETSKAATINDDFLKLELDSIGIDYDLKDYGFCFDVKDEIAPMDDDAIDNFINEEDFNTKINNEVIRRSELISDLLSDKNEAFKISQEFIIMTLEDETDECIISKYQK